MFVAASEGQGFRYEVVEHTEGYLVRSRCLDSGAVDESDKLFRTAPVASAMPDLGLLRPLRSFPHGR